MRTTVLPAVLTVGLVCGVVAGLTGSSAPAAGAVVAAEGRTTGRVQAEHCSTGTVRTADEASGGRFVFQDSARPVDCALSTDAPSDSLVLRLHGEGDLQVSVSVDGRAVRTLTTVATEFEDVVLHGSWTAGDHVVGVTPLNTATQNLYLDAVEARAGETVVDTAYTTGYTYFDNTPPGSAAISHPVVHRRAGGVGTYEDPVTLAVGHDLSTGEDVLDFPAGTRFYLPDVRRYFIVEDTCGDGPAPQDGPCHQGRAVFGTTSSVWVDLWLGGEGGSEEQVQGCAGKVTDATGALHTMVVNPRRDYAVAPGEGVFHDGHCDAGYGSDLRLAVS